MSERADDIKEITSMVQRASALVANNHKEALVLVDEIIIRQQQHKEIWPNVPPLFDKAIKMILQAKSILESVVNRGEQI